MAKDIYKVLEDSQGDILEKAIKEAVDNDNTPIMLKLLDKILPNLNKTQNLNVNLQTTNQIIDDITRSIGVIESIEKSLFVLDEDKSVSLQLVSVNNSPDMQSISTGGLPDGDK